MKVTITGSGTPMHVPGRAGPGVLVTSDGVSLLFDAGRGTTIRLADAGQALTELTAAFITHHHSDHMVGLADLLMLRWLEDLERTGQAPLPVVTPAGPAAQIARHCLDVWQEEIELRASHSSRPDRPVADVREFEPSGRPAVVFETGDTRVSAVAVHHEPVVPAVAYRVDADSGSCVISGDTTVCSEVEELAIGADVLVHEAFLLDAIRPGRLSDPESLAAYHADTRLVGTLARRAGVGTLVLTHLIPPPSTPDEEAAYVDAIRSGGFSGRVVVARDLSVVET